MQDHPTKRDYATDGGIARRKRKREKLSGKETIKIKREERGGKKGKRGKRVKEKRGCAHSSWESRRGSQLTFGSHLH